MKNVEKIQQLNNLVVQLARIRRAPLLAWLALVVVLGGLAAFNPSLAVVGSVVILLLALTRRQPVLITYGLTIVGPLTGGLARGGVIPFLRISQALVVFGMLLLIIARPTPQGKSRLTYIDLAFALYMLSGSVFPMLALYYRGDSLNLLETDATFGVSPLQSLLGPIQYYLLYRIVVATVSTEKQIITVLKLIFLASILVSVIGILQKMGVGPVRNFLITYYPVPAGIYDGPILSQRITSTLQHFSGLASYLCFIIIIALACYMARDHLHISPLLLVTTVLIDSVALVLTGTLAAWISFPFGVLVVCLIMRRVPRLAIFGLVGILLAMIIFQPFLADRLDQQIGAGAAQGILPQSLALRMRIWVELSFPAIARNLFFGAGPVPFPDSFGPAEESQYVHLLLVGGIPYFLSYLLLIGLTISNCWHHIKVKSNEIFRAVAISLVAIVLALNIMNVSGIYFTYVGGTQIYWTLLAIVVASRQFPVPELLTVSRQRPNKRVKVESKFSSST